MCQNIRELGVFARPPAQRKIHPSLLNSAPTRMQDSWLNSVTGISSCEAEPCHRDLEVILGYPCLLCATEKLDVYRADWTALDNWLHLEQDSGNPEPPHMALAGNASTTTENF